MKVTQNESKSSFQAEADLLGSKRLRQWGEKSMENTHKPVYPPPQITLTSKQLLALEKTLLALEKTKQNKNYNQVHIWSKSKA